MPETKICTKCSEERTIDRFRVRTGKGYTWRQGKCMDCESKEESERYYRDIEKSRKLNRERAKRNRHKPINIATRKRYEEENEARIREVKRVWREENRERVKEGQKIRGRKWHKKQRDELTDSYIIAHIIQRTDLTREDISDNKELIELYRQKKILHRLTHGNPKNKA